MKIYPLLEEYNEDVICCETPHPAPHTMALHWQQDHSLETNGYVCPTAAADAYGADKFYKDKPGACGIISSVSHLWLLCQCMVYVLVNRDLRKCFRADYSSTGHLAKLGYGLKN